MHLCFHFKCVLNVAPFCIYKIITKIYIYIIQWRNLPCRPAEDVLALMFNSFHISLL